MNVDCTSEVNHDMLLATWVFYRCCNASIHPNQNYDYVHFDLGLPSVTIMNVLIILIDFLSN